MTASQMPSLRDRYAALIASDEQLRAMVPSPEVWATASAVEGPVERRIDAVLEGYADRPAIAERSYTLEFEPVVDADAVARPPSRTGTVARHYLPEYSTVSFGDLRRRIRDIASAWRFDPDFAVGRDELVCMIGFASVDYAAIDLACAYAQVVSVPLQSTTSGADLDEILDRVNPAALAASIDDLAVAAEQAVRHGGIRTLIAFDYDAGAEDEWARFEAAREILERGGVATRLIALDDLAAIGRRHEWTFLPAHPDGPDRLMVIVHSSGSTGTPKGAMVTERQIADWWNASRDKFPDVIVLFAPLNHGMGRVQLHMQLRKGCLTYITLKPDMSTLFEDIRLARPTTLGFFPRVLDLVYQSFRNDVARRVRSGESEEQAQREVMAGMRHSFLGDRLLHAGVGSAPTSPEVKDFMVDCFQIRLNEGYANTETGSGAVTMNNIVNRSIVLDYRLRDVPELGYYTSDRPYPRGELCFKGKFQIKGYYKDPEATAGLLTDDGFIITGDIVEQRGPDELVLIDRRKDVIKLSQGEFVAVGPLGATFEAAIPVIHQMYIYGNSHRSYLLAVVVPDQEAVTAELGESPTDQQIKDLVRAELRRVAEEHQLKTFEVPRDFIIEHEPFSQENGLLSSVRKRLRPALQRRYGEQLKAIYEAHDAAVRDELHALKDPASELSIPERLTKLVQISLGLDHLALDSPYTFAELGGDSLGAVELSVAIEETFGVVVPADGILGPTGTLQRIATEITSLVSDDFDRPTFERVHGHDPELLHVKDLALDRFIDAKTLSAAATLPAASDPAEVVLVTGANGFLGREVCLQWMERVAPLGGRVVCLIRASDDAAAAQRLTHPQSTWTVSWRSLRTIWRWSLETSACPTWGSTPAPSLDSPRRSLASATSPHW
jgi:fatty acid CoA ligase FadD9